MSKMFVHWWEDSSRRKTCHKNERGLNFEESFLGEVKGDDYEGWFYKVKGQEWVGPFKHVTQVLRGLEAAVGGAPLTTWD